MIFGQVVDEHCLAVAGDGGDKRFYIRRRHAGADKALFTKPSGGAANKLVFVGLPDVRAVDDKDAQAFVADEIQQGGLFQCEIDGHADIAKGVVELFAFVGVLKDEGCF